MINIIQFILIVIGVGIVGSGFRVIYEWEEGQIFTFGKWSNKKNSGLKWIIPLVQRMIKVDKRIRTLDVQPQECITSDSVTVELDAVIYFKVTDTKKAVVDVEDFEKASFKFGQTALRDIVGKKSLDELLQKKEEIGKEIKESIQKPTDRFGVEISNVEVKDVILPKNLKRAMAKEAEASREKKARIIKSEAELEASKKFKEASENMDSNAMILRQLQTFQEIGAEQNSLILVIPSDIGLKIKK